MGIDTDKLGSIVLDLVAYERDRQDAKWGEQNHHHAYWMTILGEEFGEACKAALEKDIENLKDELIQVAAVAVAAVENIFRDQERTI
jgi:hypothetical protein